MCEENMATNCNETVLHFCFYGLFFVFMSNLAAYLSRDRKLSPHETFSSFFFSRENGRIL